MSVEQQPDAMELLSPTKSRGRRASRDTTRRLSSLSANRADLFGGPTVVAPPQFVDKPGDGHATALAMELAKHRLAEAEEGESPDDSGPMTPEEGAVATTDKFAFAFDIDGVLIRGGEVIPEAIEAMKVLNGQNNYNIKM